MAAYLEQLTLRLAAGLADLDDAWRERHAAYLVGTQREDGGFAGREGASDLYYTSFGLRGLALLGELDAARAGRAAEFLKSRLTGQVPIVDFLSLVYSAAILNQATDIDVFAGREESWRHRLAETLESLRRPDGGYAKTAEGQSSSLYHTFLVVLAQQLLALQLVEPQRLLDFVRSRRREDGGFVEMAPMKRSGTNPTAAAVGLLTLLDSLDEATRATAVDFLSGMQTDEGGLRANTRIPIADLLSTFTGLMSLADLGHPAAIDRQAARDYVRSLEQDQGGYHGAAWDAGCDVEYTFYGLGSGGPAKREG